MCCLLKFSSTLFKLLSKHLHKLQIIVAEPNFRLCLACPWRVTHIYLLINSSFFEIHSCFLAPKANPSKFIALYLSLLSCAVYYTHCYCYDVLSYLVLSASHGYHLSFSLFLWSESFIRNKLDILHWFAMTTYSMFHPFISISLNSLEILS